MGRRGQSGQVAVMFAFGSLALIALVGFVLMAGLLYWDQRQVQTMADGAALVGAENVGSTCTASTPVTQADKFLWDQLVGTGSSPHTVPGGWACGTAETFAYGSNYSATITYPYNSKTYEISVKLVRSGIPLQFGALLGATQATIGGWAVAQHNPVALPESFALVAAHGMKCQGSGSGLSKLDVRGSIYAGHNLAGSTQGSIVYGTNCAIYAHDTTAYDGSVDFGDVLAYDTQNDWYQGGSTCTPTTSGGVCADGFEVSGHDNMHCGYQAGSSPQPQTEYLLSSELPTSNPDPCQGLPPPIQQIDLASFAGTEPNADPVFYGTTPDKAPCASSGQPSPSAAAISYTSTVSPKKTTTYGYGPAPTLSGTTMQFAPGCYGYLDIGCLIAKAATPTVSGVLLKPGFYYFNGYYGGTTDSCGTGNGTTGGLCLNGQNVVTKGTDVSMEFVNSTSFSTANCNASPSSGAGSNSDDFGTSILPPTSGPSAKAATTDCNSVAATPPLPAGSYSVEYTYTDSQGETTPSPASSAVAVDGTTQVLQIPVSGAPAEATGVNFYLASGPATVTTGYIGSATVASGAACLTLTGATNSVSTVGGDYVQPPTTNTATIWFAAPPTSPEPAPPTPSLAAVSGGTSNLPAGSYSATVTYADPEGETTAPAAAGPVTLNAGDELQITTTAAPQGVTSIRFYLTSAPAGVSTGYVGQVIPSSSGTNSLLVTSTVQGQSSTNPPSTNTTSSSWCTDTNCQNRLVWAPPANCACGLSQIGGTFYVKGPNENSAIMGDVYWPGPSGSTPADGSSGCNYTANGVGGIDGELICDTVFIQGGSVAGVATIGYTTGVKYSSPPEIALIE